ncbi:hypothetical protein PanWU01x14_255700, partial [Parasponia andersonii]
SKFYLSPFDVDADADLEFSGREIDARGCALQFLRSVGQIIKCETDLCRRCGRGFHVACIRLTCDILGSGVDFFDFATLNDCEPYRSIFATWR